MEITDQTPVAGLTVKQLKEILRGEEIYEINEIPGYHQTKRYVYGLTGICQLFGVSHPTAQKYKDGILSDAVSQRGRIIVTDVDLAMELFKNYEKGGQR
jgi:hypothetical protein